MFGVTGRLAWIASLSIWNDITVNWANGSNSTNPIWIGLKSKTGADTRPDMYWTDNNGAAVLQLTFGVDSNPIKGTFELYPSTDECVLFDFLSSTLPSDSRWTLETCSDQYEALCELVCDSAATIPGKNSIIV